VLNSFYLFSNVAIQAMDNAAGVSRGHALKTAGVLAVLATLGFIVPLLIEAIWGDDGIDEYLSIPEWDRKNNICISTGYGVLKIPISQELRVFHGIGVGIFSCVTGKGDFERELLSTVSGIADLLPYNIGNAITSGSIVEIAPDLIRAPLQLEANRSFTGRTIYNEWGDKYAPGYLNARVNKRGETYSPDWLIEVTRVLDAITGGDGVTRGIISMNPDKVNHLSQGYFGGLYSMISAGLEGMYAAGNKGKQFSLFRDTPLKRFYDAYSDNPVIPSGFGDMYHELREKSKKAYSELKRYQKRYDNDEITRELYEKKEEELQDMADLKREFDAIARDENDLKNLTGAEQQALELEIRKRKEEVIERARGE
jgi:hypothetical protein